MEDRAIHMLIQLSLLSEAICLETSMMMIRTGKIILQFEHEHVVIVVVDGSDFGLAKRGPGGDKMYTSSRVISIGAKKKAKLMMHATCLINAVEI
ncbi:LOW QUALITY PROTEIN: hypothetical protein NC652_036918 [Populus alba x Populus x berolinensis]|nr:LOW QUALITY PROTEIN: hypothetical protein NC652_036918 [Populus alba x Populus x berolinensis]